MQLYEVTAQAVPVEMCTADMALAFRIARRAEHRIKSLVLGFEEQLKARARAGEDIPGFINAPVMGKLQWTKPLAEVLKLGEVYGLDLQQQKPITPLQAEKQGLDPKVIKSYSGRSHNGVKLVEDEDNKQARKVFQS